MAIIPVRNLGQRGIVTDVDPFDLPVEAYSFGKNIRFENGRIERGSVFRTLGNADLLKIPKRLIAYADTAGANQIVVGNTDGTLTNWGLGSQTDISASGWTPAVSTSSLSFTTMNNVVFTNRPDRVPWYRPKTTSGVFTTIPTTTGQWDPTWRAQSLRSVAGVLVALNITKGSQSLPNDVLWSNFVPLNGTPDWDIAGTTSSAGENTLAQMEEPIIDGWPLKNRLMIYAKNETWFMEYTGDNDMFRFDRQFDQGMISTDCVIEHGGIHYVFGNTDIWMHDGVSDKSLATGRVRKFIYDSMKKSASDVFFVTHNPSLNEVIFCYVSDDKYCAFPSNSTGCNRAAIYNYAADTWYFADLPYVTAAGLAASAQGKTFDQMTVSYDQTGGSFAAFEGDTKKVLLFASVASAGQGITSRLRSFDSYDAVSTTTAVDTVATKGALLERTGLDLDELKAELRGYKLCSSLYPQIRLDSDGAPLVFTVGASDHPNAPTVWGASQTYDDNYYKLDHNIAGRFLSYKMEQTDYRGFKMSGIDFDLVILGSR